MEQRRALAPREGSKDSSRYRSARFGTGLAVPSALPLTKKSALTSSGSFVPKSTIHAAVQRRRAEAERNLCRSDWEPGAKEQAAHSAGLHRGGLELFGLRGLQTGHDGNKDEDPCQNTAELWMPDFAVVKEDPRPATSFGGKEILQQDQPEEVFDGYHVWKKWNSRTARRPFWHCKESGETRWERPEVPYREPFQSPISCSRGVPPCCFRMSLVLPPSFLLSVLATSCSVSEVRGLRNRVFVGKAVLDSSEIDEACTFALAVGRRS